MFSVYRSVASLAKCLPVADFVAQRGMGCPSLQVMRVKIAAPVVAAPLASEAIAHKDSQSPRNIVGATMVTLFDAALPVPMVRQLAIRLEALWRTEGIASGLGATREELTALPALRFTLAPLRFCQAFRRAVFAPPPIHFPCADVKRGATDQARSMSATLLHAVATDARACFDSARRTAQSEVLAANRAFLRYWWGAILSVHSLTSYTGRECHASGGSSRAGALLCLNYTTGRQ